MKLSTKIKKYVSPELIYGNMSRRGDFTGRKIVLMVDHKGERYETYSFSQADEYDRYLRKDEHCTLLPLNECPVVKSCNEIIMHYTSTTYKEWCSPNA